MERMFPDTSLSEEIFGCISVIAGAFNRNVNKSCFQSYAIIPENRFIQEPDEKPLKVVMLHANMLAWRRKCVL